MEQTPNWTKLATIRAFEYPQTWCILKAVGEGEHDEEVIFTVQGIVCAIDFPPIIDKPSWVWSM